MEYLKTAVSVVCNYCGKEETRYVRCPKGHYVCDECHGKGAFELVKFFPAKALKKSSSFVKK